MSGSSVSGNAVVRAEGSICLRRRGVGSPGATSHGGNRCVMYQSPGASPVRVLGERVGIAHLEILCCRSTGKQDKCRGGDDEPSHIKPFLDFKMSAGLTR